MVDFFNEARLFAVDSKLVTTCLKKREKEKKKKKKSLWEESENYFETLSE